MNKTAKSHVPELDIELEDTSKVDEYEEEIREFLDVLDIGTAFVSNLSMVTDFYTSHEGDEEAWLETIAEELGVEGIGCNEYVWELARKIRDKNDLSTASGNQDKN